MGIFELIHEEMFRNSVSCGPGAEDTALFSYTRSLSDKGFPGAMHVIPAEGFHPQIAVAIDFTHTFVRTSKDIDPSRLVNKDLLKSETIRLAKFVKYYFENVYSYGVDRTGIAPDMPFTGELAKNLDSEYHQNKFLNELLNYMITSISVNRGRTEVGSANVTFKDNRNLVKGSANAQRALVNNALPVLHQLLVPMLPIRMWSKGRLYKEYYFPIFDGYITSLSYNDGQGFAQVQVTARDVLELARFSSEMVSPSLIQQEELREASAINFLAKPFYGHDHSEIVKKLLVGGPLMFDPTGVQEQIRQRSLTTGEIKRGLSISGIGTGAVLDAIAIEAERQDLSRASKVANDSYQELVNETFGEGSAYVEHTSELDQYARDNNSINLLELDRFNFISSMDPGGAERIADKLDSRAIHYKKFSLDKMMQQVSHTRNLRNVFFWGNELTPFRIWNFQSPSVFESSFSSRLDILREVAENTYYELYVDGAGNVHYHPQRLTNKFMEIDLLSSETAAVQYEHVNIWPGTNVIGAEEVTSVVPQLSFDELITFLKISGTDSLNTIDNEMGGIVGSARYTKYLSRFGYRRQILTTPMFNMNVILDREAGKTKQSANLFGDIAAACFLVYLNADVYTKQISCIHRPEFMDVCFPIYFPEDNTIFYANTINHSINIGGDAVTSINANFGRRPEDPPADLQSFMLITERAYKMSGDISFEEVIQNLPVKDWLEFLDEQSQNELKNLYEKLDLNAELDAILGLTDSPTSDEFSDEFENDEDIKDIFDSSTSTGRFE